MPKPETRKDYSSFAGFLDGFKKGDSPIAGFIDGFNKGNSPQVAPKKGNTSAGKLTIDLPDVGAGTKRSSGTYIALLLQLEGEKWEQIDVLTDVMDLLGITSPDVEARRAELAKTE